MPRLFEYCFARPTKSEADMTVQFASTQKWNLFSYKLLRFSNFLSQVLEPDHPVWLPIIYIISWIGM